MDVLQLRRRFRVAMRYKNFVNLIEPHAYAWRLGNRWRIAEHFHVLRDLAHNAGVAGFVSINVAIVNRDRKRADNRKLENFQVIRSLTVAVHRHRSHANEVKATGARNRIWPAQAMVATSTITVTEIPDRRKS